MAKRILKMILKALSRNAWGYAFLGGTMERTVTYICNGKASCKKVGCMFAGPLSLRTCSHTTDTRYAKYPISEHPELDFDRFEVEQIKNRDGEVVRELYFEREDYYNDSLNPLQEV